MLTIYAIFAFIFAAQSAPLDDYAILGTPVARDPLTDAVLFNATGEGLKEYKPLLKRGTSAPAASSNTCYSTIPFNEWSSSLGSMTASKCVNACKLLGKKYAGLKGGNECYCGNTIVSGSKLAADSACNLSCPGGNGQNCGGSAAVKVYGVTLDGSQASTFTCPALSRSVFNPDADHASDSTFANEMLRYHNMYRLRHNAMPVSYDSNIAATALQRAKMCQFAHTANNQYGENIGAGSYQTPGSYISLFYNEVSNYNYNSPGFSSSSGHFTQVVWKATERIGCGWAKCNNVGGYLLFCEYSPPGNYVGASNFNNNVKRGTTSINTCSAPNSLS